MRASDQAQSPPPANKTADVASKTVGEASAQGRKVTAENRDGTKLDEKAAAAKGDASLEGGKLDRDWAWPAGGRVLQAFDDGGSRGILIGGKLGDSVLAAADGRVLFSGPGPRGYGNLVIVKHPRELVSVYAQNRALAVKEGQSVKRGQKIAELGDAAGNSPRLHFEIRERGKPVDPVRFLPKR